MAISSVLTVVTAATTNDLTTLATVKSELGLSGTSEDAKIARWITNASAKIGSECHRIFGKEKLSQQFRTDRNEMLLKLRRRPVPQIVSVRENDSDLAGEDYELDAESGLLRRLTGGRSGFWGSGKITTIYWAGYELLDGLPYDLEQACIKLVAHYRSTSQRDPFIKSETTDIPGVRSKTTDYWVGSLAGGGNTEALPPEIVDLIKPFIDFDQAIG